MTKSLPSLKVSPKELTALAANIPPYLRVTPEIIAEAEAEQKRIREKLAPGTFRRFSPEDRQLRLELDQETVAREYLNSPLAIEGSDEWEFNLRRLANSLRIQGRLEEAIEVASTMSDDTLVLELIKEADAIIKPDGEFCSCVSPGMVNTRFEQRKVRVKGKLVPLIACAVCGAWNVTNEEPADLARVRQAQALPRQSDTQRLAKVKEK